MSDFIKKANELIEKYKLYDFKFLKPISKNEEGSRLEANLHKIKLFVDDENELSLFDELLSEDNTIFDSTLGYVKSNDAVIILESFPSSFAVFTYDRIDKKPISIEIDFEGKNLTCTIDIISKHPQAEFIYRKRAVSIQQRYVFVISIEGVLHLDKSSIEEKLKALVVSILFDIECSYGILLSTIKVEESIHGRLSTKKGRILPQDQIQLVYKKYNNDLIEYYHIAEQVNYLPFQFLCYYQILEYFFDKSINYVVKDKITSYIKKPDFHIDQNEYINKIIDFVKSESTKVSDRLKLQRVISLFVNKEELIRNIEPVFIEDKSIKENCFEFAEEMQLNPIDLKSQPRFNETTSKRLFQMRCSIVHANPDFDKKAAIPFLSTEPNLRKLKQEVELIKEIAKMVIINSSTSS